MKETERDWKTRLRPAAFFKEAGIFASIQGLALVVASRINKETFPLAEESFEPKFLFIWLMIAAGAMLMLFRLKSGRKLLRYLWVLALFVGMQILFKAFMRPDTATLFALVLAVVYWKAPAIPLHNLLIIFSLSGIGAEIGSRIMPLDAVVLLLALSVYDIIAVYWTKHMLTMARQFMAEGVVPGIIIGGEGTTFATDVAPGGNVSVLGTGDLVLPSILAASALRNVGVLSGAVTASAAILGLLLMHIIFFGRRERAPMAALPPIAAAAVVGFLISAIIFG